MVTPIHDAFREDDTGLWVSLGKDDCSSVWPKDNPES